MIIIIAGTIGRNTWASGSSKVVVWAISDIHIGDDYVYPTNPLQKSVENFETAINDINAASSINYVISLGDIAHFPSATNYIAYTQCKATSICPQTNWYDIPGNHDSVDYDVLYRQYVNTTVYYSWMMGNILWLFIGDTVPEYVMSAEEFTWLENKLANNQDKNILLCCHHDLYPSPTGDTWGPWENSAAIINLLNTYHVDAYIHGHIHGYAYPSWMPPPNHGFQYGTEFINVASIIPSSSSDWSYSAASSSRVFEFDEGSTTVSVKARIHSNNGIPVGQWVQSFNLELRYPFQLGTPTPSPTPSPTPTGVTIQATGSVTHVNMTLDVGVLNYVFETPKTFSVLIGTHTVTAPTNVGDATFSHWSGGYSEGSVLTFDSDGVYTAYYESPVPPYVQQAFLVGIVGLTLVYLVARHFSISHQPKRLKR